MSRPLRVLFVTPYYPPAHLGGIERAIERLAAALRRSEPTFQATVLTTHYRFPPAYVTGLPARERRPEASVCRWPSRPHTPLPLFPYYSCPVTWFGPGSLRAILADVRPDVLHLVGDGWVWAHLWLLALRSPTSAVVFTPSFHRMTPSRQWLRLPNRLLCAAAERTIVLTPQEQRDLQLVYHAPADRLRLIPWGVEAPPAVSRSTRLWAQEPPTVTSPAQPRLLSQENRAVADAPVRILCVGRLGAHKGQRWLLETYAAARASFRQPARLILVGKDEGDEATLRADISRLRLQQDVHITGELSDSELRAEYARSDVFALFSRFEAFGLVYLEAMSYGVPVVTHALGAGASLLTAGALVTAPFDRNAAATALARLVNDAALRTRLGEEARTFVAQRFSWERCADGTLRAYEEALIQRLAASRRSPA